MSNCPSQSQLGEYLADCLPDTDASNIASHLSACETCRLLADSLTEDASLRRRWEQLQLAGRATGIRKRMHELPASDRAEIAQPEQLGRFKIEGQLGRGGFGVVYLARDAQLGRLVAIKVPRSGSILSSEQKRRFLREGLAAAALHHPHIVPVFETGQDGDLPFLVAAYCSGGTLAEQLRNRENPLSFRQAALLISILADAIHYAHNKGVLHRDLKPANVLLEPPIEPSDHEELPWLPRVADFGLATFLDGAQFDQDPHSLTMTGVILGTPRYMAPEQLLGRTIDIGRATDVYALGAILYELLVGVAPLADLPPHVAAGMEPVSPRRLQPKLSADLEASA